MSALLPQRLRRQPQGAVQVDWGNSLTNGLRAVWHPAARQYIGPGNTPTPTAGTYSYLADSTGGYGVKFNGAANARIALPAGSAGFAANYSGTRLVLFRANAANLGLVSGTVSATLGMRLNSATQIALVASGAAVISSVAYTIPTSSGPTVALCTADSVSTQTRMHVNGQILLNTTYSGYTASTAGVWVGAITNHSSASNFFLALSWDRALSIPEAAAIQENPWQIFKPGIRRSYFLPLAPSTLSADPGAYNITGLAATLATTRELSANSGSYSITGSAATLEKTIPFVASPGAYSLVGSAATLARSSFLSADSGQYDLTGAAATLFRSIPLSADAGSYQIDGKAASLTQAKQLSANSGSYQVDGQAATFIRTYNLLAVAGAFNLTGSDASLLTERPLSANAGAYSINGVAASLFRTSLFPDPGDVREGVVYGPGGIYVGTLKVGGKILFIFDD
jgi:hypothetical protein